jgi:hypothetical protein
VGVAGTVGRQAGADVNYRLSRRTTVGLYYSFTNYAYSHHISQADSHGVGAIYSYALNRGTQLRTRFGATHQETLGYATVALDPALAAILGQSSTIINSYSQRWISDISVELVRDFRRSRTASLAYARGQSPGNGVLLTSVQETYSAGYVTSFFRRRLPINVGFDRTSLTSSSQNFGAFTSETAYAGTSRALGHGANATLRFDYRRYQINDSPLSQHEFRFSLGLTWSPPGELLRF